MQRSSYLGHFLRDTGTGGGSGVKSHAGRRRGPEKVKRELKTKPAYTPASCRQYSLSLLPLPDGALLFHPLPLHLHKVYL